MVIHIDNKPIPEWNSWDFVKFFLARFRDAYMNQTYPLNHVKDSMIMKRITTKFRKHGRSKEAVIHFIDWVFKEYKQRDDFTEPLTIGFLPSWIDQYLHIIPEDKKKKRPPPKISPKMKGWIAEARKKYKPNYGRHRL